MHKHHSHEHDDHSSHNKLTTNRLEAFSDGVLAIIITITVLEFKIPQGTTLAALKPLLPLFIAYLISFETIGTYWNNHHHLLRATKHVGADIMWSNLLLLFCLSLIPFATGWLGANHGGQYPTALYAFVLLLCAISYSMLQWAVVRHAENRDELTRELSRSKKGIISLLSYAAAAVLAFYAPAVSDVLIIFVALIWFVPDRRIERLL